MGSISALYPAGFQIGKEIGKYGVNTREFTTRDHNGKVSDFNAWF